MQTQTDGQSPGSATVADPATVPATAPAEARSLPTDQPAAQPKSRQEQAQELLRQAREPKPATPAQPAETPPAGDTPPAETPAEATPAPTTDPNAPDTPAGDTPPTDTGPAIPMGKRLKVELPETDEVGRLAAAYLHRNTDMTLEQAMQAAKKQLGIAPETAPTPAETPAAPAANPDLPQTLDEVDQAIKIAREEAASAASEARLEDQNNALLRISDLQQQKFDLQRRADQEQIRAESQYSSEFRASQAQARDLYAFADDENSAGGKRMLEIDAALKATDDPLYYAADKTLRVAQMVAAELNIAPRSKTAQPTAKPAAPATPQPKKNMLPGGGSMTVQPVNPSIALSEEIAKIPAYDRQRIAAAKQKLGIATY